MITEEIGYKMEVLEDGQILGKLISNQTYKEM